LSNYRNIDLGGLAGIFGALSNPRRPRIFLTLASRCRAGAGEISSLRQTATFGETEGVIQ
jgi:hypothetical protein